MIELPKRMRARLIDQIDENFGAVGQDGTAEEFAAAVVEAIELTADEYHSEAADELVGHLEASAELDDSLEETLADGFEMDPELDTMGDKVVVALERMCSIEWRAERGEGMYLEDDEY